MTKLQGLANRSAARWMTAVLLLLLAIVLYRWHWIKAYSDPTGWITMAENFYLQGLVPKWSFVYALYLYWPLQLLGPHYVYLSNLPWIILLVALTGGVTYRCLNKSRDADASRAAFTSLWLVILLIHFNWRLFGELINPYREAVAMSLLMASLYVLAGPLRDLRLWRMYAGGALFGLSVAMREPNLIAFPALVALVAGGIYETLPRRAWKYPLALMAGVLIGLIPFFAQNAAYSGYWWIPAYLWSSLDTVVETYALHPLTIGPPWFVVAVSLIAAVAVGFGWRRAARRPEPEPEALRRFWRRSLLLLAAMIVAGLGLTLFSNVVPAMKTDRFLVTGPATLSYLYEQWSAPGLALLVIGLFALVLRKEWGLLGVTAPVALLFLFFWSFYTYVKARYVFAIELFALPIIAYGAHTCTVGLARLVPAPAWRKALPAFIAIGVAGWLSVWLGVQAVKGSEGLKVWHLGPNQEALAEALKHPPVFDCARSHHAQLLATTMGGRFTGYFQHRGTVFQTRWEQVWRGGVETGLARQAQRVFEAVNRLNIYDYGYVRPTVRFWLDRRPIMKLSELPHPLIVYGRVMDDWLYELVPWSRRERPLALPDDAADEPVLLGLDLYRLWDYPDRTYCRVENGAYSRDLGRTNHFQWLTLPAGATDDEWVVTSDAALPAEIHLQVHRLNDTIQIALGGGGAYWYRNYLSDDLVRPRLLHGNAALLLNRGSMKAPVFADRGHDVFARIHFSYYQEEPHFRGDHMLTIQQGDHGRTVPLPRRNVSAEVHIPLGRGGDAFELRELVLTTTLPGARVQMEALRTRRASELAYVLLNQLTVWSLPNTLPASDAMPVDPTFDPWLVHGFYPAERGAHGAFRWTEPEAEIELPVAPDRGRYEVRVTTISHRPEDRPARTRWYWNGEHVEADRVEPGPHPSVMTHHFSSVSFTDDGPNRLRMVCDEWVPRRDSDIADSRSLGIGFMRLAWQRIGE